MKIAIVDDERPARSELQHILLKFDPEADIYEADSGAAALELMIGNVFDLVFIDVNLGDLDGTSLAVAVKRMMPKARIVFATAFSEYAIRAFEIGVSNYILKPFDQNKIEKIVNDCMLVPAESFVKPLQGKLPVNCNRSVLFLDIEKIIFIETDARGCIIHTEKGDFNENRALGDYEKKLNGYNFFRIHKSYLINLDKVQEIFPWHNNGFALKLSYCDSQILPVGREKIKELRALLNI